MSDKTDPNKAKEDEPLAEHDASDCAPAAPDIGWTSPERDLPADQAEVSLREEIFETYKPKTLVMVEHPVDGLPIPKDETSNLAVAHPFTRETVVCVEDDTEFVELFDDELEERGWSRQRGLLRVERWAPAIAPKGLLARVDGRFDESGQERVRRTFEPSSVKSRWGVLFVEDGTTFTPVRPRRERCKHFLRQVMANDDLPNPKEFGHFLRFYNCGARKSVGGALMTLRDEAVYACDYRSPPDPGTTKQYLDDFDKERLEAKRHEKHLPLFNLGIFGG